MGLLEGPCATPICFNSQLGDSSPRTEKCHRRQWKRAPQLPHSHANTHVCTPKYTVQACTHRQACKQAHACTHKRACICMQEYTHACEYTRCKHAHTSTHEQIRAGRRMHTQTCTVHTHAHPGSCSTVLCSRSVIKGPGHRVHAAISASSLSWSHTGLALSSLPPRSLSLSS